MRAMGSVVLSLLLLLGCQKSEPAPQTLGEAKEAAAKARDEAKTGREAGDTEAAAAAAERAHKAGAAAKDLLPDGASSDQNALYAEAAEAAKNAKRWADLAEEDARLAELVSSWKAKSYRGLRGSVIKGAFTALELAARQAKASDLSSLGDPVKTAALAAADLGSLATDRPNKPDGSPDWEGIAADMDAIGSSPPPGLSAIFALGFLLSGRNQLALYEIEMVGAKVPRTPDEKSAYHVLRGVTLSMNGLPNLGAEQMEQAAAAADRDPKAVGPKWLAVVHMVLAWNYISQRELKKADLEIVRAMQAWPDNPISVFLTGERFAADGQYEEAADSLAKATKGTKHEWLSKKLASRAREVRDKKGAAEPLFFDTGFMCNVMIFYVSESAEAKAPQQLKGVIPAARWLGNKLDVGAPAKE